MHVSDCALVVCKVYDEADFRELRAQVSEGGVRLQANVDGGLLYWYVLKLGMAVICAFSSAA